MLVEGSYFGEISLIFGCKRTASVISNSYCTLAFISRKKLYQLQSVFEMLISTMKRNVVLYQDELKLFIESEMEKIPYFSIMGVKTKQEIFYAMERQEFNAGTYLCKRGDLADRMYLIQQGHVDIFTTYGKGNNAFTIERL